MHNKFIRICAVVVTYNPEIEHLSILVQRILEQVDCIWIIDNGSSRVFDFQQYSHIYVHKLDANIGIASAQNIGIRNAIEQGAIDIIFFDQDSIPSPTLIDDLLNARLKAELDRVEVAAIGPVHYDIDSSQPSVFIRTVDNRLSVLKPDFAKDYMSCDFLISSGCLISVPVLKKIGLMEDGLFIDCVDIEWGFRAKDAGLICVVATKAKMDHKIGDKPLMLFNRQITTHSPIRHYYFYRNFYSLLMRDYVPLPWKLHVLIKSSIQAIIFCLFLPPRLQHFKSIVKGIYHGLIGRANEK